MLIKIIGNWVFAFILNFFTRVDCYFNVQISPRIFLYLIKTNPKVNLRNAMLGQGVKMSEGCAFYHRAELFGDVRIGRYTSISGPSTRICAEVHYVEIGSFCSIASNVIIQEFYHGYHKTSTYNFQSNIFGEKSANSEIISKGPIVIEDDVWIGSNAVVLSGIKIGRGAIVGAGAVVTKDVQPYSIVAGNPAKFIRMRFSDETIRLLEKSRWWCWDKEKIRQNKDFFTIGRF